MQYAQDRVEVIEKYSEDRKVEDKKVFEEQNKFDPESPPQEMNEEQQLLFDEYLEEQERKEAKDDEDIVDMVEKQQDAEFDLERVKDKYRILVNKIRERINILKSQF